MLTQQKLKIIYFSVTGVFDTYYKLFSVRIEKNEINDPFYLHDKV